MFSAIFVCMGWVLALCLHEFGHALVAYKGGDVSVKNKGYLTFNILRYTDLGLTLIIPLIFLALGGIGLPGAAVYIDHSKLRSKAWESAVAAAGPAFSVIAILICALPFMFNLVPMHTAHWVWTSLAFLVLLQCVALVLNLLPFPGLDGFGIIEPWLPDGLRYKLLQFSRVGIFLLYAALWLIDPVSEFIWRTGAQIMVFLDVPPPMAALGYKEFTSGSKVVVPLIFLLVWFSGSMNSRKKKAQEWYQLGNELRSEKKPEEALQAYGEAVKLDNNLADAWHERGMTFAQLGQYEAAIENMHNSTRLKPADEGYWYNLACCYSMAGRVDDAVAALKKALDIKPEFIKHHALKDAELAPIRGDSRFQALVNSGDQDTKANVPS